MTYGQHYGYKLTNGPVFFLTRLYTTSRVSGRTVKCCSIRLWVSLHDFPISLPFTMSAQWQHIRCISMKCLALVVKPFNARKKRSHATFPQSQIADNLSQQHIHPWGKNDRKKTSVMINIKWPCYTVCQICHKHWFPDSYELTLQEYSKTEDNLSTGVRWPYLHFFYLILLPSLRCKEDRRKRKHINPCILNITVNLHENK